MQNYPLKVEVGCKSKVFFGGGDISVSDDNVNCSLVHFGFSRKVNGVNLVRFQINKAALSLTHTQSHSVREEAGTCSWPAYQQHLFHT